MLYENLIEKIKKLRQPNTIDYPHSYGYNKAISDVLKILQSEDKKLMLSCDLNELLTNLYNMDQKEFEEWLLSCIEEV